MLGFGQTLLGLLALVAPRRGGETAFAWRLFGARQVCLGFGGFTRPAAARKANLVLQPIDLGVFVRAYSSHEVPRRVAATGVAAAALAFLNASSVIPRLRRRGEVRANRAREVACRGCQA